MFRVRTVEDKEKYKQQKYTAKQVNRRQQGLNSTTTSIKVIAL